jgi:hypothetical protein
MLSFQRGATAASAQLTKRSVHAFAPVRASHHHHRRSVQLLVSPHTTQRPHHTLTNPCMEPSVVLDTPFSHNCGIPVCPIHAQYTVNAGTATACRQHHSGKAGFISECSGTGLSTTQRAGHGNSQQLNRCATRPGAGSPGRFGSCAFAMHASVTRPPIFCLVVKLQTSCHRDSVCVFGTSALLLLWLLHIHTCLACPREVAASGALR